MAETARAMWPATANIVVYAEGFDVDVAGVEQRALPAWFEEWKARHIGVPAFTGRDPRRNRRGRTYDYRYDCVRFAHKIAAITDAGARLQERILIWMDADILTHARVTEAWLRDLHPVQDNYMAWLDRDRVYPECGFMMFRTDHLAHEAFMGRLEHVYRSGQVFNVTETHDSYVIAWLVQACVRSKLFPIPWSLSGSARKSHHPFVHSRLGECMDHVKGFKRKETGRTPATEVKRTEEYWR